MLEHDLGYFRDDENDFIDGEPAHWKFCVNCNYVEQEKCTKTYWNYGVGDWNDNNEACAIYDAHFNDCKDCGHVGWVEEHDWDAGVPTEEGMKYTCSVCHLVKTRSLRASMSLARGNPPMTIRSSLRTADSSICAAA